MPAVVIHSYLKTGGSAGKKAKAHIRYIQHRPGKDKERSEEHPERGERREIFDDIRDSVERKELEKLVDKERGAVSIHKLTLSPGVQGADLKEFAREVMDEFGKEKGLNLQWARRG